MDLVLLLKLTQAFVVGALGSAAYITALYFKFIGDSDDKRQIILWPFCQKGIYPFKMSFWKCLWYCVVGGFVATVFQFDVPNFVAVQCLILGATWPAIVSQFLSGRMAAPSEAEQAEKKEFDKFFSGTGHENTQVKGLKAFKNLEKEVQKQKITKK